MTLLKLNRVRLRLWTGLGFCFVLALSFLLLSKNVPSFENTKALHMSSSLKVLDRDSRVLHIHRMDYDREVGEWVDLREVSPYVIRALIRAEDRNFYSHMGVDHLALMKAMVRSLVRRKVFGASTISMQLTKEKMGIFGHSYDNSFFEKLVQLRTAYALDGEWSKDQILEAYLNKVPFRSEVLGLSAASRKFFSKAPNALNIYEASLLAAMIRSPNREESILREDACKISKDLDSSFPCPDDLSLAGIRVSKPFHGEWSPQVALHFPRKGRGVVRSTLDLGLQSFISRKIKENLTRLKDRNVNDYSAIVIHNKTGEIWAYVGSAGEDASAKHVNGVEALRQAGSTLKPMIFATAFDNDILKPKDHIDDSSAEFLISMGGVYRPSNFDNQFHGLVSVQEALGSSLNVPAVKILDLVGIEAVLGKMELMNFKLREAEFYGPSLALGSADVSLRQLADAYRSFANDGEYSLSKFVATQTSEFVPVYSKETALAIKKILSDRQNRILGFGGDSLLDTPYVSAVKTGTSQDMRDSWCVGFSEHFTVATWAGNFDGSSSWSVSSLQGAGPLWRSIMDYLQIIEPSYTLGTELVKFDPQSLPDGTENRQSKITYPTAGAFIALDPDIPAHLQQILLEYEGVVDEAIWELDGKRLATSGSGARLKILHRGKHTVVLKDKNQGVIDQVTFFVR